MNAIDNKLERGQAIVYLVIGLVVFLGFVALAIDGGMALADRRHDQNAADAASLAGGGKAALDITKAGITSSSWSCGNGLKNNAEFYAQTRAIDNGFDITYNPDSDLIGSDYNYAFANCGSDSQGVYLDVTVEISATTPSNFLQLVFPSALHNEVEAVTRVRPGGPLAFGNAIVALNPESCAGASKIGAGFRGTSDTIVTGGGIFSNGCLTGGGSATVNVGEPYNTSYNDFFGSEDIFTPPPVDVYPTQIPPSSYDVPEPTVVGGQCVIGGTLGDSNVYNDVHNISATVLMNLNKHPLTLDPGLWCITGTKDLSINSNATAPFHANGVTIYVVENIDITINGGADLELTAPVDDPDDHNDDPSPAIPGLVIYIPASNDAKLTINGGSNFTFTGTILAPGSHIKIDGGTDDVALNSQVIGWDVELIGSATIDVTYLGGENSSLPTSMELHR
jgi:hypothetical protein